jgi:thioesterase domain-containing protein
VFYADPLHGAKEEWLNGRLKQWDEFTRAPNRYIEVSGEHHTVMRSNHVGVLHAALRVELDRALRGR